MCFYILLLKFLIKLLPLLILLIHYYTSHFLSSFHLHKIFFNDFGINHISSLFKVFINFLVYAIIRRLSTSSLYINISNSRNIAEKHNLVFTSISNLNINQQSNTTNRKSKCNIRLFPTHIYCHTTTPMTTRCRISTYGNCHACRCLLF